LTELLRTGARRLIEAAVSAEFEEKPSASVQEKLPDGRQRVVRNGHPPERQNDAAAEDRRLEGHEVGEDDRHRKDAIDREPDGEE